MVWLYIAGALLLALIAHAWGLARGRTALERARPQDIREHRQALRYFMRNQTSIGCYGGGGRLRDAEEAISFFAYAELPDELGEAK